MLGMIFTLSESPFPHLFNVFNAIVYVGVVRIQRDNTHSA